MSNVNETDKGHGIQSVSRAIAILRCFSDGKEHGLTEVSKSVGLHKSTAAGLVNTLKAEGFLEQDEPSGKLRLGLELLTLAVNARSDLNMICEPHLQRLLEETNETVNLAVLVPQRAEIVYIAKKESSHSIRISTSVGQSLPVHCTAIGKSILAAMGSAEASKIIQRINFIPFTDRTITNAAAFVTELDMISSRGYAYDDEEFENGVVCVAVALGNSTGYPIGAISVSGPVHRMEPEKRLEIADLLKEETRLIRSKMSRLE